MIPTEMQQVVILETLKDLGLNYLATNVDGAFSRADEALARLYISNYLGGLAYRPTNVGIRNALVNILINW